jgi:hypothetical protein
MIFVAMDDTDNINTRGTGRLSRNIAAELSKNYPIAGVVRHQLFLHPDIPYTSHNSCAVIHMDIDVEDYKQKSKGYSGDLLKEIFQIAKREMLNDFIEGSDPGLAVASDYQINPSLVAFGRDTQQKIVTQGQARALARNLGILLEGLGGTEDGVIGTMAGIGLSSTYNDGRYIFIENVMKLYGEQSVETLLEAGIDEILSVEGEIPEKNIIIKEKEGKSVKPSPINKKVVLFAENIRGEWKPIKRK